jgi:hypothetical protein
MGLEPPVECQRSIPFCDVPPRDLPHHPIIAALREWRQAQWWLCLTRGSTDNISVGDLWHFARTVSLQSSLLADVTNARTLLACPMSARFALLLSTPKGRRVRRFAPTLMGMTLGG